MKIGIDARMYGPQQTGIGNYIKYLILNLAQLDNTNEYYVFLGNDQYRAASFSHARFHKVLSAIPWYSLAEQLLFVRQLLSYRLDIMHFPHFNASMLYRRPFVVTIHDLTPRLFPGEKVGKSWIRRQGYNLIVRNAVRSSRMIIAPSQYTKQDIVRTFSAPEDKIAVIYEGIPLAQPQVGEPVNPALRRMNRQVLHQSLTSSELCIDGGLLKPETLKPYILYVGVWRSHKNLEGLIRAFSVLKQRSLPYKLVLVGDPDIYYQPLKTLWQSLGLGGQVLSVGFQNDKALAAWYKHASLLVLPSFSEGFGLTPLIGLFYGVPVAVSDIPVLREILGDAAFYFNPFTPADIAQTLNNVLTQPDQAKQKFKLAGPILATYRWDDMARKTLALYERSAHLH